MKGIESIGMILDTTDHELKENKFLLMRLEKSTIGTRNMSLV